MSKESFSSAVHKTEYIDPDEEADRQTLEELASPSLESEEVDLDNLTEKYAIDDESEDGGEGGVEEDIDLSKYDKRMRVIGVFKDDNFPESTIVKTRDMRGFVTGFAIRRNSEGDLEGNRIHYLESGDVGAVFKLHEHDFLALEEKGFLDLVEKLDPSESKEINVTNVFRDSNFPGSIIVKTEKDGRDLGFAIRRNSEGDLEGNRIHYLESGDVGAVFKLHEHNFLDPEMTEVLNAVRNFEDAVEVEFPEKEAVGFPFHHKTSTLPRTLENPELLNTREASKEFLSTERSELAKEIWEARKRQRERLTYLKLEGEILNNDPEELPISVEDSNLISLAERQSDEANSLRERLESSELNEESAELEKENLKLLISSSSELESLKNKLKEHYEKADDLAKEHFESIQRSVEQTILRNNVFFIHMILQEGNGSRHNSLSNVGSRSDFEDDIDILLSLEPSISTSTVTPNSKHGVWAGGKTGLLISGGGIGESGPGDISTGAYGIKNRHGVGEKTMNSKELDEMISNRDHEDSYNELVVNNPKPFGFFRVAGENDAGQPVAFFVPPRITSEKREEWRNDFIEDLMLANKEGTLPLIMTQDRRFFEFIDINSEDGTIVTGMEITPEMVARGNAGLSDEARLKIGERLLDKKVFKTLRTQIEAREILAEISGEKIDQDFIEEEKIDQALKNESFSLLPKELLADKEFMIEHIHLNPGMVFRSVDQTIKDDKDFIKKLYETILDKDPLGAGNSDGFYRELSPELKHDEDIITLAIKTNEGEYLSPDLEDDPVLGPLIFSEKTDYALKRKKFSLLPEKLLENKEFMIENMHINPVDAFRFANESLRTDKEFIKEFFKIAKEKHINAYRHIPEALKLDEEILALSFDNDWTERMDFKLTEDPSAWEVISDKLIEKYNPEKLFSEQFQEGKKQRFFLEVYFYFTDEEERELGYYSVGHKLENDQDFFIKLHRRYPGFAFKLGLEDRMGYYLDVDKIPSIPLTSQL